MEPFQEEIKPPQPAEGDINMRKFIQLTATPSQMLLYKGGNNGYGSGGT